jgi:hypothetical protein
MGPRKRSRGQNRPEKSSLEARFPRENTRKKRARFRRGTRGRARPDLASRKGALHATFRGPSRRPLGTVWPEKRTRGFENAVFSRGKVTPSILTRRRGAALEVQKWQKTKQIGPLEACVGTVCTQKSPRRAENAAFYG